MRNPLLIPGLLLLGASGCGRTPLLPEITDFAIPHALDLTTAMDDLGFIPDGPRPFVPFRFAAIADYGDGGEGEMQVARLVHGWKPDFLITLGDNNYGPGRPEVVDADIGQFYSDFIGSYVGKYGKGSAENRFWPSMGNHDWDAGAGSARSYLDYFPALPEGRRYYDVVIGNIHFFSLDSDPREPDGTRVLSAQARWLEPRLRAPTACFKIVYFHHPPYSSGDPRFVEPALRWPFPDWGADIVLTAHQHQYERLAINGFPYVVAGLGGVLNRFGFPQVQPESIIRYNSEFGALRADVTKSNIRFEFRDTRDQLIDSFALDKLCP